MVETRIEIQESFLESLLIHNQFYARFHAVSYLFCSIDDRLETVQTINEEVASSHRETIAPTLEPNISSQSDHNVESEQEHINVWQGRKSEPVRTDSKTRKI